jgi:hypothetical protein
MSWDLDQVKSRRLQYALHILPVLLLEWLDAPDDFPVEEILDFFSDRHRGLEKVNKWLTIVTAAKAIRGDSQWATFTARFLQLSNLKVGTLNFVSFGDHSHCTELQGPHVPARHKEISQEMARQKV